MNWISLLGIYGCYFINYYFLAEALDPIYKWNSVKFLGVRKIRNHVFRLGFRFLFFKRAIISNALGVLGWISKNWDSVKNTRRLSHIDSPSQGVTLGEHTNNIFKKVSHLFFQVSLTRPDAHGIVMNSLGSVLQISN